MESMDRYGAEGHDSETPSFDSLNTIHPTLVSGAAATEESRLTGVADAALTDAVNGSLLTLALVRGDHALTGQVLAERYRLERPIGRGGMGIVYEARHLMLDRTVAVKLLRPQMLADERAFKRFIREAQAMALIEHPNAVTVHDFGVLPDGAAFLVMEYLEGETLRSVLGRDGKLSLEAALNIIEQVAGAVDAAHRQGVLHRDLKPENIMFKKTEAGPVVKVVDFGLAKVLDAATSASRGLVTSAGELFGTPVYMAPEFFEGEEVTTSADIYALGVTVYEMLAGQPPFHGSVQTVMSGHLFKEPPPINEINPAVPVPVDRVLRQALGKRASERFPSAVAFAARLREAMYAGEDVAEIEAIPVNDSVLLRSEAEARSAPPVTVDAAPLPLSEQTTDGAAKALAVISPLDAEPDAVYETVRQHVPAGIFRRRTRMAFVTGGVVAAVAGVAIVALVFPFGSLSPDQPPFAAAAAAMPTRPVPPVAEEAEETPPAAANEDPGTPPNPRPAAAAPRERTSGMRAAPPPKASDKKAEDKKADGKKADGKKKKRKWFNPLSW